MIKSLLDKFGKARIGTASGHGIALIPGARGNQMTIEAKLLKGNYFSTYLDVERLPECEQKIAYLKLIIEKCLKKNDFHSAIEPVLLLPDKNETAHWLEVILEKNRKENRGDWMMEVLRKFPKCERLPILFEESIKWFLENHDWSHATETAALNGRELTVAEAESFIAANLTVSLHQARSAAKTLDRSLTDEELKKVIEAEKISGNYRAVFRIAVELPDSQEKNEYIEMALCNSIKQGNMHESEQIANALGRKLTNSEIREIFVADGSSRYAYLLAKDKSNVSFLLNAARKFTESDDYGTAFEIYKHLPDSEARTAALEMIGNWAEQTKRYCFVKEITGSLMDSETKNRLQLFLVRSSFEKYKDILVCENSIKAILDNVAGLKNGPEKLEFLEILFGACQKLEERDYDERGRHQVTNEVEKLLNEVG